MARGKLLSLANVLGLLQQNPDDWFKKAHDPDALSQQEIEEAIFLRQQAKELKDFSEADRIRDSLALKGVVLQDSRNGTGWRRS